jgi:hypothetical protein
MNAIRRFCLVLLMVAAASPCLAVQLKVSRISLERTLRQQLFNGPEGRYYLKGSAQTPCFVYAEDPHLVFANGRIAVQLKTHAKLGTTIRNSCFGISLAPPTQVSVAPDGQGETLGFRDAKLDKVSDHAELNMVLSPFLSRQIPNSMRVNAADLLRKALAQSTATSGYKVSLNKLMIHSITVQGDDVILDVDAALSIE